MFKLLIGSTVTSPAEKDSLRRAVEWIDYLDGRFRRLSGLSRSHSMLYSGVVIEKVFRIFWEDRVSVMDKENKPTSKPIQPLWGLAIVDKGINDRVSIGVGWDVVRTPTGHDQVLARMKNGYIRRR